MKKSFIKIVTGFSCETIAHKITRYINLPKLLIMMSVFDNNITLDLSYSVSRDPWVFSQISVGVIRSDLLKPGGPPHLGPPGGGDVTTACNFSGGKAKPAQ
jgi:hypothetical protein